MELKLVGNGRLSQSVLGKGKVTLPSCCRGAGMPVHRPGPILLDPAVGETAGSAAGSLHNLPAFELCLQNSTSPDG